MLAAMRILMLTQWFDPEPTFKGLLMAQELERRGHQVSVITGFPNYPGGKLYDGYRVRPFRRERIGTVTVTRVALYPSHDSSGIRRLANYLSFAFTATIAVLFVKRPDVAYVYHPPATIGLPAFALKVFRGVPFVYDVQDLWPDTLAATGMISGPRVLSLAGWILKRIYRSATHVVVLSDGFRRALVDRGVPERRITVIPNWADEARLIVDRPAGSREKSDNNVRVTFAGNIGPAQELGVVLDAAELITDLPEVRFVLIGGGVEASLLRADAVGRGIQNVEFLPRRPIDEIGADLVDADALLVHLRDDPLFEITIPSKTQAYMMAGRPILMGVRGDAARMVNEASAGISFEPGNPSALAQVVREFVSMSRSEREAMGRAAAPTMRIVFHSAPV